MWTRVRVARELIEEAFRTDYSTRGVLRVIEGLPPESRLVDVRMEDDGRSAVFLFQRPGVRSDIEERDIRVECTGVPLGNVE